MLWLDYAVESAGKNFTVKGEWPGEVMGGAKDGTPKEHYLYKPGDVFIVNENGWLMKSDELSVMILKYEASKDEVQTR